MKCATAVLLLIWRTVSPAEAELAGEDRVHLTKMTGHLYRITAVSGFEVNFVASIGPDGILLVDTRFKDTAAELKDKLHALGQRDVKFVINTHAHVDHTGGNRFFGQQAVVISHPALRGKIQKGRYILDENPDQALLELTLSDSLNIHFNGEEIPLLALPGSHDNDDLLVHFTKSKVVYMGDLAYGMHYPTYDTDTGDAAKYAEIVGRALEFLPDDVLIVSGHGKDCTIPEMREFQAMLSETTRIVVEALESGRSTEEIEVASLGKWANYAGEYQDAAGWIRALAGSVKKRGKPSVDLIAPMYLARKADGIGAAIARFNSILNASPGDYHLDLYIFGKYLVDQEAWNDAAEIFALANSAHPDNPYVWLFWFLQAEAHLAAGDSQSAREKYQRCLELKPDYAKAKTRLVELTG
ncbi:MAG: MBL fold metallo-hydrolase [Acidobacteriota bacterium]|nr:MAG: MBL fold metallo-hydrolase [Acidobacteriota bacterium]